jgi:hypothetical protein
MNASTTTDPSNTIPPPADLELAPADPSDVLLAKLQGVHGTGNVAGVNTKAGWLFFRKPKKAEYDRFISMLMDDKQKAKGLEALALVTVVHPSREAYASLLEGLPGLSLTVADAIQDLAGVTEKAEVKK